MPSPPPSCVPPDAAYMPHEAFDIDPADSMEPHFKHLKDALEVVTGEYRLALPKVKNGGLSQARGLNASRAAVQHEIRQAGM